MVGRDSSLVRLIAAGRELLEDREQRARAVLALEAHDRRLVVAGRRGDAAAHEHEAGLVLGVVLDLAGEHLEAVDLGARGALQIAAMSVRFELRHLAGRLGGGVGDAAVGVGQLLRQPAPALRERVRERDDGA